MEEFLKKLSSKEPVPGGGGVAALVGALAASLGSMVGNLTSGKEKYAMYQDDIERIIGDCTDLRDKLFDFIEKDAKAFEPLSRAYGIPKEEPGREEKLERALLDAAVTPLELIKELDHLVSDLEELTEKGSRIAISDVGVAAALLSAAARSAILNVLTNTGLMKNTQKAVELNEEAMELVCGITERCDRVYTKVYNGLEK